MVFSLSDRYKIFTSNWLWIKICENVVLSKIDITMTTILVICTVPCAQFWLEPGIFPPIPMFAGKCCSRTVAVFLSISYLIVQSASVCKLKIVLNSCNICSNETATNCCHCHKIMFALGRSFNFFVEIVTKYGYCYDILSDLWFTRAMRLQTRRLESLSI